MRRYHDLDALRAFAMLLGIAWHVSVAYQGDRVISWLNSFSHTFRMPLFFLIAGFFASMLVARRGESDFVTGRLRRIGLPLAVGLVTIVPATQILEDITRDRPIELKATPLHLWFLEYLLIFYALALAARRLGGGGRAKALIERVMFSAIWRLPVGVAISTAALVLAGGWPRQTTGTLVPSPGAVAYYGVFFAIGWLLWSPKRDLGKLERTGWAYGLVAVALIVPFERFEHATWAEWLAGASVFAPRQVATVLISAVMAWCMIFALMWIARRLYRSEHPYVRYIVDASYWMYLVHLPIAVASVRVVDGLPAWPAFLAATLVTGAASLGTYALFVRHGRIGDVLHGPRPMKPTAAAQPAA